MYAIIVANAPGFDAAPFVPLLRAAKLLIAADGGGNALHACGVAPQLVIGDLDSLEAPAQAWLEAEGATLLRYPAEKDETDLELALLLAVERGAQQIDVLGALGGRWDHSLANVALLALPNLAGLDVRLRDVGQQAFVVRGEAELPGNPGDTISLLPLGGPAHDVSTRGLYYPLHAASLSYERSRGVSNLLIEPPGHVRVGAGMLLVVHSFAQPVEGVSGRATPPWPSPLKG